MRNPQWKSADEPFEAMKARASGTCKKFGAEFAAWRTKRARR